MGIVRHDGEKTRSMIRPGHSLPLRKDRIDIAGNAPSDMSRFLRDTGFGVIAQRDMLLFRRAMRLRCFDMEKKL